jgi:hypothetical protein
VSFIIKYPILIETGRRGQILIELSNIKFHESLMKHPDYSGVHRENYELIFAAKTVQRRL